MAHRGAVDGGGSGSGASDRRRSRRRAELGFRRSGAGPSEPGVLLLLAGAVQGEAGVLLGLPRHPEHPATGCKQEGEQWRPTVKLSLGGSTPSARRRFLWQGDVVWHGGSPGFTARHNKVGDGEAQQWPSG